MRAILALAFAAAGCVTPPPSAAGFPQAISGLGTEPFWNVEIDGEELRYSTADAPIPRRARLTRREAAGRLEMSGALGGQPIQLTIRAKACSDGMSDRRYPLALDMILEDQAFHGCAHPQGQVPKNAE